MRLVLLLLSVPLFGAIAFVQVNSATPQPNTITVPVTYLKAQTAGDLNVIAIGWNDVAAVVSSVADTSGNAYLQAVPKATSSPISQTIYYAKNIKAAAPGANVVTVTFSPAAGSPDVRILEYSGVDPTNPVDTTAAGTGNSTLASTATVTVPNATDLLFAAETTKTSTPSAGSGFTSRVITQPDSDIAEDRTITAAGSYSATAPIAGAGAWVIQMVALKAAGSSPPPPQTFSITSTVNGLANGNYTITSPVLPGYTVTPASQTVTINGANAMAAPFAALTVVVTPHAANLTWGAGTPAKGTPCTPIGPNCFSSPVVVAGYNVYRATKAGGPYTKLNPSLITVQAYNDTSVAAGQTLYYVAATVDSAGNISAYSNQATAVIP
jgi:hypothetical protein